MCLTFSIRIPNLEPLSPNASQIAFRNPFFFSNNAESSVYKPTTILYSVLTVNFQVTMGQCCDKHSNLNNDSDNDANPNKNSDTADEFENETESNLYLPDDCWQLIFCYSTLGQWLSTRLVCHQFNKITNPKLLVYSDFWRTQCQLICCDFDHLESDDHDSSKSNRNHNNNTYVIPEWITSMVNNYFEDDFIIQLDYTYNYDYASGVNVRSHYTVNMDSVVKSRTWFNFYKELKVYLYKTPHIATEYTSNYLKHIEKRSKQYYNNELSLNRLIFDPEIMRLRPSL